MSAGTVKRQVARLHAVVVLVFPPDAFRPNTTSSSGGPTDVEIKVSAAGTTRYQSRHFVKTSPGVTAMLLILAHGLARPAGRHT